MATATITQENESEAPAGAEGAAATQTPAAPAGSGSGDRVTLLESRLTGLEARLTEAGRGRTAAEKERDEARSRLAEYEQGKITDNEAFQAELQRERDRAAAAEKSARLAQIEARYPEAFSVLGETAAGLTEEVLAATEARFKGTPSAEEEEPPTPRNPTEKRSVGAKPAAGDTESVESLATMRARFKGLTAPWQQ